MASSRRARSSSRKTDGPWTGRGLEGFAGRISLRGDISPVLQSLSSPSQLWFSLQRGLASSFAWQGTWRFWYIGDGGASLLCELHSHHGPFCSCRLSFSPDPARRVHGIIHGHSSIQVVSTRADPFYTNMVLTLLKTLTLGSPNLEFQLQGVDGACRWQIWVASGATQPGTSINTIEPLGRGSTSPQEPRIFQPARRSMDIKPV